jgi:hypothetical protein
MSYAAATTLVNNCTDDATFRTWGSAWAAKWASMGLVQTADTGQINWTTVVRPGTNTAGGYEIWRFADTLQSTYPVFLKIEYGIGASAANPSLWLTVASGTNGAGTVTGVPSTRQQITCTSTVAAISHYWSGDTNRIGVAAVGASAATAMGVWVERTVDANGAVTSEGCLIIYRGSSAVGQQAWNWTTGPYTASFEASLGIMGPVLAPWSVYGTQVAIYPCYHTKGVFLNPGLNVYGYEGTAIGALSTISFTVYGASHTFFTLPSTVFGGLARGGFSSSANQCIMMRYE